MNHVYRIVFNRALGLCQVVSELASTHGGAAAKAMCLAPRLSLLANACLLVLGMTMVETASAQTVIENRVLEVNDPAALTGDVTLASNGELRGTADITLANHLTIEAATTPTISAATGTTLTLAGTANLWSGAGLAFGSAGHTGTVVISSPGFTTSGTRSALDINYGTLRIGNGNFLTLLESMPSINIAAGAILDFNDSSRYSPSTSINNLQGAGTLRTGALSDAIVAITGGDFSGVIEGAGGIEKRGSDTLTLSGVNTYSGGTTINDGTLALGAGGSLATASAVNLSGAGAGFDISAATTDQTIGSLAGVAGSTVTLGTATLNIGSDNSSTLYAGAISGTGNLIKQGTGGLTLTGGSSYEFTSIYDGTLTIKDGGKISSRGGHIAEPPKTNAAATVSGMDSTWANSGELVVGLQGTGALTVADGATVSSFNGVIGYVPRGDGRVTVTGTNSTWSNSDRLSVGHFGRGILSVADGGKVSVNQGIGLLHVAWDTTSTGSVNIGGAVGETAVAAGTLEAGELRFGAGTGSLNFNHTDAAYIFGTQITGAGAVNQAAGTTLLTAANNYTGRTTISGGTLALGAGGSLGSTSALNLSEIGAGFDISAATTDQTIGSLAGVAGSTVTLGARSLSAGGDNRSTQYAGGISGTGGLTKVGSGTLTLTGSSNFGRTDVNGGTLAIQSGGTVSSTGSGFIGGTANTKVTVNGAGSTWTTSYQLHVGGFGNGTLAITDGGAVSNDLGRIGAEANTTGDATVSGKGATWTNSSTLTVGWMGHGTLTVANGGVVSNAAGSIALSPGSIGSATVSGAGSAWRSNGSFIIGQNGYGTLTVADAGAVHNIFGGIGSLAGSTGIAKVTGADTIWTNDELYVGISGTGILTVQHGSKVLTNNGSGLLRVAIDATSTGTVNIGGAVGETAVAAGTLEAGELRFGAGTGSLNFNHTDATHIFDTKITGAGTVNQVAGTTLLTGANSYTGDTTVSGGTLAINGSVMGDVQVNIVGTLGGNGRIGGNVNVLGALSAGNSPGTLSIGGKLVLGTGSKSVFELGQADVVGGTSNDLVDVGGDLTLGGTLQAQAASAGWYRLFNYGGTLSGSFDSTQVSSTHAGFTVGSHAVDTATANQVNLTVLATGQSIQFWDGSNTSPSGLVGGAGGAGSWSSAGTEWTNDSATTNSSWAGSVAHFGGTAGTVSVIGTQRFDTLQFASDGYLLTGDSLALSPTTGSSATINTDAGVSATVASSLINSGRANGLTKVGSGTLILSGANSFSGVGTQVLGGTLVVAHDSALGSHQVAVDNVAGDSATLQVNAGINLANSVFIDNNGTLDNYGAIVNAVAGGAGVKSSGGATINNAGGTIQAMDANGHGIRIDGLAGTVTNTGGGLITGEASGISINGNGAIINDAGTISGTGSSGDGIRIRGTGAVTNANGSLVTGQNSGVIMFDGGTLLNSGTISSADGRGVQIYDSTGTITNTADGIISGVGDAVYLDGGGTLTNNGGAIVSTGTFPHIGMHFIDGHGVYASQLATITNIGGGTISSQTVGVGLYRGGSLTNGVGSTVQGTNGSFDVASGDAILNNSGTMRGGVRMSDTGTHHVTLFDGSRIEGHLDIGNDASTLALGGTGSQLYSDAVTGSTYFRGQLLKQDSGTWRIDSALTDIKNTTLSAGTLQIGDGGTSGAIAGDVLNNAALAFNRSDDVEYAGNIIGSGALQQLGSGITTLSGNNNYSGGTIISAGTLAGNASNFGSGAINIAATGALAMQQNSDASFANLFAGSGHIHKNGGGTLNLTGDSATFTGTTHINAGTLAVNGALGGMLNVHDGATLKGTGSVGNTVVMAGGTIAPGNSIGRLNVAGDLAFAAGSTYQIEATPDGNADHIHASGAIALQGGSAMVLAADGSWSPTTTYQVLSADAGISGAFDEVSANFAFLAPTLTNDGHILSLTLARNQVLFPAVATTPNQIATSTAIESLGAGQRLYDAVVQLDQANAVSAFDQLSGEVHASVRTNLILESRFVREAAIDRLRQHEGAQDAASDLSSHNNAWGRMYGSWGRYDGDGNAARNKRSTGGIVVGGDRQFDDWNVGLMAASSHSKLDIDARRSHANVESYQLGLYAGTTLGDAVQLRSGVLFGRHSIETDRTVTFTGLNERNRADYHARSVQAFGELGWKRVARTVELESFANLAYVGMTSESFREQAGISALSARKEATDTLFSTLGLRAGNTFSIGSMQANWRMMTGWRHAFNDVTGSTRLAFANDGSSFAINGLPVADDALAIEAGAELTLRPNLTVGAAYSGQHGDGARDHGLKANVTWVF